MKSWSKVKVKVTRSKFWYRQKGIVTRIHICNMKALSLLPVLVKIAKDRQTGGQTNRPTDGVIPIYPPNFICGGWGGGVSYFVQCNSMYMKENIIMSHLHLILFSLGWVRVGGGTLLRNLFSTTCM